MTRHSSAPLALAGLLVAIALALSSTASASHYRITPGFELVTESERKALKAAGVQTTAQLLKSTAKKSTRRAFAKKTRLSLKRLKALAQQCDLLRVKGLGPSAVRLLQAAKLQDIKALKRANAPTLHKRLLALKATLSLPQVVPAEAELKSWIAQAKGLKTFLEGIR